MFTRVTKRGAAALLFASMLAAGVAGIGKAAGVATADDGVVRVRSAYQNETWRIKRDVAAKGIMFFAAIDQAKLAADAGIELRPSTLLLFGNPALGVQFITANPQAGLDWPVRLLVTQDATGAVWAVYTEFDWIARRHRITDRTAAFAKASEVITSIVASAGATDWLRRLPC